MRLTTTAIISILAAIMGLPVHGSDRAYAQLIPFRVGIAAPANTFLAIWVAQDAAFYEAHGLKIEFVQLVGGRESGPELKTRRVHLIHVGMSSVIRANVAGGELRNIGSLSNVIRATMFAAPQIKTNSDLKGGVFGISSEGSESDSATTLVLNRLGMTRRDVIVREIGTERLTPLRNGTIAATLLGEPQRTQAIDAGLRIISDLYAERIPWLYSGLTVDRGYLAANRDTLVRFLKATIEGNHFAISNEKRAKDVLARELKLTDQKIIDQSYANFKAETPLNAEIDVKGAENVLMAVAPPNASRNLADYIDTSLSDGLRAEGFFAATQRKFGAK